MLPFLLFILLQLKMFFPFPFFQAYKEQALTSHSSGGWEVQDQDTSKVMSVKALSLAHSQCLLSPSSLFSSNCIEDYSFSLSITLGLPHIF